MEHVKTDHMEYIEGRERTDSESRERVLEAMGGYDYSSYTEYDVRRALCEDQIDVEGFKALLSPAASCLLEEMAVRAKLETAKHFGNSVAMFTPLYISNYCENHCVYCGFNCYNKIHRGKLEIEDIKRELINIADTGLREILLLTGESRSMSDVLYIGEAVRLAAQHFTAVGIEIYPLNTDEYDYLRRCGADYVCVYQETYNTYKYEQVHQRGHKRIYPYRFNAQERALRAGIRGVSFGALLGLDDFRRDAFATGLHAHLIQRKYPQAEISFSTPRLRPFINNASNSSNDVHEPQLLQVMLAYRLFMPFAGITISTRERAEFRDNVIGMCATKISAGVKVSVGGHEEEAKGDEQFEISDPRGVREVHQMMLERGLQPVYTDYLRV